MYSSFPVRVRVSQVSTKCSARGSILVVVDSNVGHSNVGVRVRVRVFIDIWHLGEGIAAYRQRGLTGIS